MNARISHLSSKLHKPKSHPTHYIYLSPPAHSAYGGPVARGTDKLDSRKHWLDLGACQLLALLGIIQGFILAVIAHRRRGHVRGDSPDRRGCPGEVEENVYDSSRTCSHRPCSDVGEVLCRQRASVAVIAVAFAAQSETHSAARDPVARVDVANEARQSGNDAADERDDGADVVAVCVPVDRVLLEEHVAQGKLHLPDDEVIAEHDASYGTKEDRISRQELCEALGIVLTVAVGACCGRSMHKLSATSSPT